MVELHSIADRELTRLERSTRLMRTVYPRWILLKANSNSLSGRLVAANNMYNQAVDESRRIFNHLEESLALAARSKSKLWIQNARNGRFPIWQIGAEQARSSWHQLLYKVTINRIQ
ncbi:unnamed protein product [Diatraea saccharalis]|uniref:Uncharacterized protein n=1 Tax=Diatraea saccharalis TaxID=40085 RepID=A0A9N9RBJ4_9NEOP|nr:unnamed protein product [Diatraea saccharalis]